MKVTYNWLKDFVDIKIPPKELADKLTMAGLEVTSLEEKEGDFVFEIEITSNRPDWLSVVGIAREVAAITGKRLKLSPLVHSPLSIVKSKSKNKKTYRLSTIDYRPFDIKIENKNDCPLYIAVIISDAKVASSPSWLKKRLELVGLRSINNVVDITNYIMLERGEPLHAFDLDKMVDGFARSPVSPFGIVVRRAKKAEEIVAIDGEKRVLDENALVIAFGGFSKTRQRVNEAKSKPVAIAGIMGGKDSEVTESTRNILLEAALFDPVLIRRGRQKLGIQTESAYRFERGISAETVLEASLLAANLIEKLSGAKTALIKSSGAVKTKERRVNLELEFTRKMLGVDIPPAKITKILAGLGFKIKSRPKSVLEAIIPATRRDITQKEDLAEEIARIYGFENIPKTLPAVKPAINTWQERDAVSLIKSLLVGLGLNEVITYSLVDRSSLKLFGGEEEAASGISNPLSKEQEFLRLSILPGIANCVKYNLNQKQENVAIFEIAKTFRLVDQEVKEGISLAIALSGTKTIICEQGFIKEEAGLSHLKGALEVLFERLGVKNYSLKGAGKASCFEVYIDKEKIGSLFKVEADDLEKLEIKNKEVFLLEVFLEKILKRANFRKIFSPLPKYPSIKRDLSFLIKEEIPLRDVLDAVREKAGGLLDSVRLTDYYKGKQVPGGQRSLTISCLYRSGGRTLTESEINPLQDSVAQMLSERFGAKSR